VIERVRAIHQLKIERNFAQDPILRIIRQNYGGNLEVGLRSPEVMELLSLYAMASGQPRTGALAPRVQASLFTQRGGVFTQAATFANGSLINAARPLSLSATRQAAPVIQQTVILDPQETRSFWETQTLRTVAGNPDAVSDANLSATRRNYNRREQTALTLAPGVITA